MAFERITVDPARMGGLPTIRDTRVTVGMVLGQLATGQAVEELLTDYPYLERDDVLAALEYAAPGRTRIFRTTSRRSPGPIVSLAHRAGHNRSNAPQTRALEVLVVPAASRHI